MKKKYDSGKNKNRQVRSRYGLEPEQYEQMFLDQENRCAICNKEGGIFKGTKLVVDHDHTTSKVRQLLCNGCNRLASAVEHDVERFLKTLKYLKQHDSNALAVLELKLRGLKND